jgi:hypothetical protein
MPAEKIKFMQFIKISLRYKTHCDIFPGYLRGFGNIGHIHLSFLRKQESAASLMKIWIPAFAGMTGCVT